MLRHFQHFRRRIFCLTIIFLLLTSCAYKQVPTALYLLPKADIASPASSDSTDPELLLVQAEPEQCLTEELETLSLTGTWHSKKQLSEVASETKNTYDFPIVMNKQVKAYLDIFQNSQKRTFSRWLARSGQYLPMFQQELRAAGLPEELAYLAMIESGFNQRAYSQAKAVGLWQFIRSTGKLYNLRIDRYVDERRHAEKSTKAAVAFLSDLYADFGDWHLAVAGYNAGPGKIRRGMKRYKVNDFWSLAEHRYLRLETKRYVPKLIAAILIARNPEKYGFNKIVYEKPIPYETLRVGPGLSLDAIALICNTKGKTIKQLNQELKTGRTPLNKSYYDVQIPKDSKELAEANLPRLSRIASTGYKTHIIRQGDTISAICKKYNINKTTLLKINNLRNSTLIAGKHLRIPHSSVRYRLLQNGEQGSLASSDLILHKIRTGETISKIADQYNVPADLIVVWNGLADKHKIRAGQQLALYIDNANSTAIVTAPVPVRKKAMTKNHSKIKPAGNSSLIVLSAQKKFTYHSTTTQPTQVSWYKVRSGDSLWKIAKRFKLSTEQLKSWNNLKSNQIHPGVKLKIRNV